MFRVDLTDLTEMLIVFGELAEDVVLAVLGVHLLHQLRVARSQIYQFVLAQVQVHTSFFYDNRDDLAVYRPHLAEELQCMVTADHIVLKDVVDLTDLFVNPSMHQRSNAACLLPSDP